MNEKKFSLRIILPTLVIMNSIHILQHNEMTFIVIQRYLSDSNVLEKV